MKKFTSLTANRMHVFVLPLIALLAALGGCATPATHEGMVPVTIQSAKHHPQAVAIAVIGGKETSPTGKVQISDSEMKQALTAAINQSKAFSRVVQGAGGDYLLTVNLFSMEQPSFGLSFTVKLETGWTLKRVDTGAVVWQEAIKSEHTATTSDAFAAVTRIRLATEGAARNGIAQGLAKISKLTL